MALLTLGRVDFVYTAMEKSLNESTYMVSLFSVCNSYVGLVAVQIQMLS